MNKALRDQVLGLPADEKLELVMDVWDSIDEDNVPLPTEEQLAEAERRRPTSEIRAWDHLRMR